MSTPEDAMINLTIKPQDGDDFPIRVLRNRQLKELMQACCDLKSVHVSCATFSYRSHLLGGDQTPNELKMEDGDEIHAIYCPVSQSPQYPLDGFYHKFSHTVMQAMSIMNATINRSEEIKAKDEVQTEAIGADKKVVERDVVIKQLHLENEELRHAKKIVAEMDFVIKQMHFKVLEQAEKKVAERDVVIKQMHLENNKELERAEKSVAQRDVLIKQMQLEYLEKHNELQQAEKKVAEMDILIKKMRLENKELQQAKKEVAAMHNLTKRMHLEYTKLREANATISRMHSDLSAELVNIKNELLEAKEEVAQVRRQVEDNKRDGSFADKESQKRACLDWQISTEQCPVGSPFVVNQDAVECQIMARKPESLNRPDKIDVGVLLNEGSEPVWFRMKRSLRMKKLMHAYCDRQQIDIRSTFFYYDSDHILMEDTPYTLQINNGDAIHAQQLPHFQDDQ